METRVTLIPDSSQPHPKRGGLIISRQSITNEIVKSSARTLEILQYFDLVRREVGVKEVAEQLGYPQSSTSVLLRSLVKLGYLDYNSRARTYISSIRVALLGSWVYERCVQKGELLEAMSELSARTGDTIVLAVRNGLQAQYIHVIQAQNAARLKIAIGTVRPIAASSTGHAMLALLDDAEVAKIVRRVNAERGDAEEPVELAGTLRVLREIRQNGYAFGANLVTPGGGMIIAPLPKKDGIVQLFLGAAGIAQVMEKNVEKLKRDLVETITKYYGVHPSDIYSGGFGYPVN